MHCLKNIYRLEDMLADNPVSPKFPFFSQSFSSNLLFQQTQFLPSVCRNFEPSMNDPITHRTRIRR